MTKIQIIRCDRCGKNKQIPEGESLHKLVLDGEEPNDVCEDCNSTFWYFWGHVKEFDALAEQICEKENPE